MRESKNAALLSLITSLVLLVLIVLLNLGCIELVCTNVTAYLQNSDNKNMVFNVLIGLLTGFIVSAILSYASYSCLKRRTRAKLWNICRKLYQDICFILPQYLNIDLLTPDVLRQTINQNSKFCDDLKQWMDMYGMSFLEVSSDYDTMTRHGDKHEKIIGLQESIAKWSIVIQSMINYKVIGNFQGASAEKIVSVIRREDNLADATQKNLEAVKNLLKTVEATL